MVPPVLSLCHFSTTHSLRAGSRFYSAWGLPCPG
jgi:hypothetical protein